MPNAMPRPIIVHAAADAEAACRAAAELGAPLLLVSGAGAGVYAGAGWFREMIRRAALNHPAVEITAVLDCADQAGIAAEAFSSGIGAVLFSGGLEMAEKVRSIAAARGAVIYTELPPALDLRGHRDPVDLCRRWLAGNADR